MSNSTRSFLESSYDIGPCDSTQTSSIANQLRAVKDGEVCMVDYRNCSVLQCMTCNTVFGDSLGICGEVQSLQSIICLKVTENVSVNKKLEMSLNGHLALSLCPGCVCAGCPIPSSCGFYVCSTHQVLHCAGCHGAIGLVLHSTPKHLSALRNLFLLRKELINCYMLRSGACVKASKINFKHRLMDKNIKELKQDLEAQLKQVKILKEMMEKLCTRNVS